MSDFKVGDVVRAASPSLFERYCKCCCCLHLKTGGEVTVVRVINSTYTINVTFRSRTYFAYKQEDFYIVRKARPEWEI